MFTGHLCTAQITMQPLLPQVGFFQKSQLWNVLVVNGSSGTLNCYLTLSLQDRQSGAEVLSATSTNFSLNKEAKQLNVATLTPIQYSYFSFTGDKGDDFLPAGSYTACFKLLGYGENAIELAEACVPFDVEPLSPPMLIMPADSSILQLQPAQFTWQPPAPLAMFQQLHYELLIAEILPGQRPEEAIELNAPFYTDLNIQGNVVNYTGAYPSFEKDKWYAWQVVARDGESYGAKTEVWDFSINAPDIPVLRPVNGNYIELKNNREGSAGVNTITNNVLGIKYYCFEKNHSVTVRFIGPDGEKVKEIMEPITYGDNFLGYKLDNNFKKGTVYSVEITDDKKNKRVAFFIMK
jgi:hypothetical protein